MKRVFLHFLLMFVALVIVLSTLSISQTVYSKKGMENMRFGYPLTFVTQDLTGYDPPFPWQYNFSSPWENPFTFNLPNFLLSYLIILFIAELIVALVKKSCFKH